MWRRFSEEERQTIWDMREAGVPVKRIAKHLGRQNVSVRKFIADAGGKRPTARERSELRLSLQEREEISRGLAAGESIRAIAGSPRPVALDYLSGGERQWRPEEVSGPRGRSGGMQAGAAPQASQVGPVPPASAGG
jgi:transposase-like protein